MTPLSRRGYLTMSEVAVRLARLGANPATCPKCGGPLTLAPFGSQKDWGGKVEWLLACRRWAGCAEAAA